MNRRQTATEHLRRRLRDHAGVDVTYQPVSGVSSTKNVVPMSYERAVRADSETVIPSGSRAWICGYDAFSTVPDVGASFTDSDGDRHVVAVAPGIDSHWRPHDTSSKAFVLFTRLWS